MKLVIKTLNLGKNSLKKRWPEDDFTHNHKNTRVKCPICLKEIKGANHVELWKSLAVLWRHMKQQHPNLSPEIRETKEVLRGLSKALNWGMILTWPQ